ncbi:MAG: PTS sugar transporter subunit IIA [Gammaproteobacteria bacterium]|nr:PTS sugar transporter subunit IIA [Gammaproteobacteria bacterium]MDH5653652.1 PTS sugar transporter subunit IIA [Gammaproteobacteria bacterium]
MSVGILVITHSHIGKSLCDAAISVLGNCPLPVRTLPVSFDCEPEEMISKARELIKEIDQGEGVLVLTDMYGSTPSNIACSLRNSTVKVVAGINLPMLVRIMNYPQLDLVQLTEKALSGGHEGVLPCHPKEH